MKETGSKFKISSPSLALRVRMAARLERWRPNTSCRPLPLAVGVLFSGEGVQWFPVRGFFLESNPIGS